MAIDKVGENVTAVIGEWSDETLEEEVDWKDIPGRELNGWMFIEGNSKIQYIYVGTEKQSRLRIETINRTTCKLVITTHIEQNLFMFESPVALI